MFNYELVDYLSFSTSGCQKDQVRIIGDVFININIRKMKAKKVKDSIKATLS